MAIFKRWILEAKSFRGILRRVMMTFLLWTIYGALIRSSLVLSMVTIYRAAIPRSCHLLFRSCHLLPQSMILLLRSCHLLLWPYNLLLRSTILLPRSMNLVATSVNLPPLFEPLDDPANIDSRGFENIDRPPQYWIQAQHLLPHLVS